MKALVLTGERKFQYKILDDPRPSPGEVLVRVRACGICGSDVHGYDGSTGRRIPPVIMGHEAAGEIEEIGNNVNGWSVGDRVTFDSTIYCNECVYCRKGMVNLCNNRRVLGVSCADYRQDGAMAEYIVIPQHILYRIPDHVSFEQASMVEPLSVAFHAVGLTPLKINDSIVVVGAGMIGLLIIQTLRLAGCGKIIAVDIDSEKLELAKTWGADFGIQSEKNDTKGEILKITGGEGADVAIDVVGINNSILTTISSVKKGGQVTLVGNLSPKIELPLQEIVTRQIHMRGSCASSGEYGACLDMIARKAVNIDFLMSEIAPLSEGQKWFDTLYEGKNNLLKVILKP